MDNNNFDQQQFQPQYQPQGDLEPVMTLGDWLITLLVLSIPCVGFVFMIIWAIGGANTPKSKTNFVRAQLIFTAIFVILYIIFVAIIGVSALSAIQGAGYPSHM